MTHDQMKTHDQTTSPDQTTTMKDLTDEAGSVMGSVAADLQAAATRTFDKTVGEVKTHANDAKANVASEVNDVAMALRRASEDMRGGSAQERTLGQIATSLADASDALRDKDLGEIMQAAKRVARDHPALFLGGAALLGFAASRYAKATSDRGDDAATPQTAKKQQDDVSFSSSQGQHAAQSEGSWS